MLQAEDVDASQDDILKLDATAEVDEFSKFLNDFEDELRTEKKNEKKAAVQAAVAAATGTAAGETVPSAAVKRPRMNTERKVVDGKRLRKKVKPSRREQTPSMSPEGGAAQRRQSPLRVDAYNRYRTGISAFNKIYRYLSIFFLSTGTGTFRL
jgi:hypothetical protein